MDYVQADDNDYDYSLLPEHILIDILKSLQLQEIKQASLVCKSWYAATLSRQISRRIGYRLGCHPPPEIVLINRPFSYLQLYGTDFNHFDHTKFLMKFHNYITRIHFYECTVTFNQILECLVILENLESLEINISHANTIHELSPFVDANYMGLLKNMSKLKMLTINGHSEGANFILSKCCNLKKLTYINQCKDAMVADLIYEGMIGAMNQWKGGVNLDCLQMFDQNSASRITFLEIFGLLQNIQIKCLDLTYFGNADSDFFEIFFAGLSHLQELIVNITKYSMLHSICKHMVNLRKLTVKIMKHTRIGIIGNLSKLEELVITARDVPEQEIFELCNSKLKNLQLLHLHQIVINRKCLSVLCENFKNLEDLQITINTTCYHPIYKNLTKLKKLGLYWYENYNNNEDSVEYDISNLKQLEKFHVDVLVPNMTSNLISQLPNFPFK